jgi:hypothetical protein
MKPWFYNALVCSFHYFDGSLARADVTLISLLVWLYVAALFVLIGAFYWQAAHDYRD